MGGLSTAAELRDFVLADPKKASVELRRQLDETPLDDGLRRSRLLTALGLAWREQGDLDRASDLFARAAEAGRSVGHAGAEVRARLSLAGNLIIQGRLDEALVTVEALDHGGDADLRYRIASQLGIILARSGRVPEAGEALEAALEAARSLGNRSESAATLHNLGMLRLQQGRLDDALDHTEQARVLFAESGLPYKVAYCDHNLALISATMGDLPAAFDLFERAERQIREFVGIDFEAKSSYCRALLAAGLFTEAASAAGDAASRCDEAGLRLDGAEARLLQASALVSAGRHDKAAEAARASAEVFADQGRDGWAASALLVEATARLRAGDDVDPAEVESVVGRLAEAGFARDGLAARLLHAEVLTDPVDTLALLDELAPEIDAATVQPRIVAAAVRAAALRAAGDGVGAEAEAVRGMDLLVDHQATLGAADLRVGIRQHALRLIDDGVAAALADDDAERFVAWVERDRSAVAQPPPLLPTRDRSLDEALAHLRADDGSDPDRRRDLEDQVSARARSRTGVGGRLRPLETVEVMAATDGRTLVTYRVDHGQVAAAVLAPGRHPHLHRLGPLSTVTAHIRAVRHDLQRRTRGLATTAGTDRLDRGLDALADLLIRPLGLDLGPDRDAAATPLVVAPSATLFAVPWAVLPGLRGRPLSIVPSLSWWAHNRRARAPLATPGPTVLVAGPDLPFAPVEVAAVARVADDPVTLTDADAHPSAVLDALEGAGVAHVVAHGTVHPENPLLSGLGLAGADLNAYDLQRLARPPRIAVLSSCHVGLPAADPGRELLGLTTGLLTAGAATVIAGTMPVADDEATVELMTDLHRNLGRGLDPAQAWAEVQQRHEDRDPLVTAGFAVFGLG